MRRPQDKLTNAWVSIDDARADQNGATVKQLYQDSDMPDALREAHDSLDATVDRAFGAKTTCVSADERKRVLSTSYVELTSPDHLPIPQKARARR
ncbi:type IIL restriction-modification enzyme MmeI [Gordonia sp. (in: high G+C Gram-positive bacteria)]|uniref:type IIL restriction-modification enzyme MmeI n=1 Tax=Gordonia sp. (in: high G+C Gram-positive bacteria) TaxID=84139 RepID=UPI003C734C3B